MADEKLKTLIHYVCDKCIANLGKLGSVKLRKVLWNTDVASFVLTGRPITSEKYIRRQFAPTPLHLDLALEELVSEGRLQIRKKSFSKGYKCTLFISTREVEAPFDHDQRYLIDSVIAWIVHGFTETPVSMLSSNAFWKTAAIGEEIPHYTAYAANQAEVTEKQVEWAKDALKKVRPGLPAGV